MRVFELWIDWDGSTWSGPPSSEGLFGTRARAERYIRDKKKEGGVFFYTEIKERHVYE